MSEIIDTDNLIGDKLTIWNLKVKELKKQLGMRKLSKQGNKNVLIDRLLENLRTTTSTETQSNAPENTVMAATDTVDTSQDTNPEQNDLTDRLDK